MEVLRTKAEVRAFVAGQRAAGQRIGFVPTMGALHRGHLALMEAAAERAAVVITSIFVNPTQFGPGEDFDAYPRDAAADLARCAEVGCHAVFLPSLAEIYPPGASTVVQVPDLATPLCGRSRPEHFAGVCTVVLKLLNIVRCDVAVFGEKDYQQLAIIRRMVRDLDVAVEIHGHPIVREADGLAMSSRNAYLSPAQRQAARCLSLGLADAEAAWLSGERRPQALEALARARVSAARGAVEDYVELRDAEDLSALKGPAARPVVLALAVRFGRTRLIDNRVLAP